MRVVFGTDEATAVTDAVLASLRRRGHDVESVADGEDWVAVGRAVGEAVAAGRAQMGVVCCWSGTGVAMAANKVPGVRAALCPDAATAAGARRWNDANVLAIGLRLTSTTVADELLDAFLAAGPDPSERSTIARLEEPAE